MQQQNKWRFVATTLVTGLLWAGLTVVGASPASAASTDAFPGLPIGGTSGTIYGDNYGATSEPGEQSYHSGASVWYAWTAPANGPVHFNTCYANYDSALSVWRGDSVGSLSFVTGNDDWCGLSSGVWFYGVKGTTYHLRISGYSNHQGSFPLNWNQTVENPDADGDGTNDADDAFPNDPTESADTDGDGVGNNADAFDNDPTETTDTDGDGVGNNADAFDNDPTETTDTDGDGVGDNADAFDNDPTETTDTDGDGVGDNGDVFPADPTESADADEDGTGDNADVLDDDPLVGAVALTADGVCGVVKSFVTKAGVANSLCVKLAAGSYGAFGNELRAQTGKAITAPKAASLRSLVALVD